MSRRRLTRTEVLGLSAIIGVLLLLWLGLGFVSGSSGDDLVGELTEPLLPLAAGCAFGLVLWWLLSRRARRRSAQSDDR